MQPPDPATEITREMIAEGRKLLGAFVLLPLRIDKEHTSVVFGLNEDDSGIHFDAPDIAELVVFAVNNLPILLHAAEQSAALRERVRVLEEVNEGLEHLLVFYRCGKRPNEATLSRLDKAKSQLAALSGEEQARGK